MLKNVIVKKNNKKYTQSLFSSREHQQVVQVLEAFIRRTHHRRSRCSVLGCFSVNSYCWILSPLQKEEVSLVKVIRVLESGGTTKKQNWNNRSTFQERPWHRGENFLTPKLGPQPHFIVCWYYMYEIPDF